ncbi:MULTISPECIES: hypothetical protein [Arthrobacter]|uniref:hypothetical protein n=1 Tax=Arthrobacter TaxID=1663 RepID=UPI0014055C44|nr:MULTISPECIES: hypothetical protein [Arthrobacter]MBT8159529.1 hypothetical protein [Arthrobacter sp. GN70]
MGQNPNITINGRYYAGVDGADLAGGQWGRFMDAATPEFSNTPFPQPPAAMLSRGR